MIYWVIYLGSFVSESKYPTPLQALYFLANHHNQIDKNNVAINPIIFTQTGRNQSSSVTGIWDIILYRCNKATIPNMVPDKRNAKSLEFIVINFAFKIKILSSICQYFVVGNEGYYGN